MLHKTAVHDEDGRVVNQHEVRHRAAATHHCSPLLAVTRRDSPLLTVTHEEDHVANPHAARGTPLPLRIPTDTTSRPTCSTTGGARVTDVRAAAVPRSAISHVASAHPVHRSSIASSSAMSIRSRPCHSTAPPSTPLRASPTYSSTSPPSRYVHVATRSARRALTPTLAGMRSAPRVSVRRGCRTCARRWMGWSSSRRAPLWTRAF